MRVLVAYATHYGATRDIAARICQVLAQCGVQPTLRSVDEPLPVEDFDAFVIGSSIHAGHWLKTAKRFVEENAPVLSNHPVWIFSSGPLGESAGQPQRDPKEVQRIREAPVRDHRVFGGAFDRTTADRDGGWFAHLVERFMPEGDFRDWDEIEAWARGIASELKAAEPALTH